MRTNILLAAVVATLSLTSGCANDDADPSIPRDESAIELADEANVDRFEMPNGTQIELSGNKFHRYRAVAMGNGRRVTFDCMLFGANDALAELSCTRRYGNNADALQMLLERRPSGTTATFYNRGPSSADGLKEDWRALTGSRSTELEDVPLVARAAGPSSPFAQIDRVLAGMRLIHGKKIPMGRAERVITDVTVDTLGDSPVPRFRASSGGVDGEPANNEDIGRTYFLTHVTVNVYSDENQLSGEIAAPSVLAERLMAEYLPRPE
jgi:hypothetical protein